MSRDALITPISEWLIDQSVGNTDIVKLFEQLCFKLIGVGIPLVRARLFWPTLHPLFQAETVSWNKNESAFLDQFEHQDNASQSWLNSPLNFLLQHDLDILRRQLTGPNALVDFELLEELKEQGVSDYLVIGTKLSGTSFRPRGGVENQGILVTWASDKQEGFSDDDLRALQRVQKRFAAACKTVIQSRISSNIAHTYLGERAGKNVLAGQIRRGDGSETKAIVWYSDLRNSTSLAESMGSEDYFALLNSYFHATAQPVVDHGGEILDFIGDAVLGIFPFEDEAGKKQAAENANHAIKQALELSAQSNLEKQEQGAQTFDYGIAVNVGSVLFGNIGIPTRLAFSVIGPTVNQAARIEGLTKSLPHTVLAEEKFARLVMKNWTPIGKHKLEGTQTPVDIFAYQPTPS